MFICWPGDGWWYAVQHCIVMMSYTVVDVRWLDGEMVALLVQFSPAAEDWCVLDLPLCAQLNTRCVGVTSQLSSSLSSHSEPRPTPGGTAGTSTRDRSSAPAPPVLPPSSNTMRRIIITTTVGLRDHRDHITERLVFLYCISILTPSALTDTEIQILENISVPSCLVKLRF